MGKTNQVRTIFAIFLICLGIFFMISNLIPGLKIHFNWPVIFLIFGVLFCLPAFIFPEARVGLSALFIPGGMFFSMWMIFYYNTLSGDWASWGYAWLLILSGIGCGLAAASINGGWGKAASLTGFWLAASSFALFAFFAAIFGNVLLRFAGPVLIILLGIYLISRAFIKNNRK